MTTFVFAMACNTASRASGTVTMPIRVAVLRGEEVLYSELHKHVVQVGEGSGAVQFLFANPDITMPIPADGSLQVFAGYDEGPPRQGRSSDAAF